MPIPHLNPIARGAFNVALNSSVGYSACKFFKKENPRDLAITLAIDTTLRIVTKHCFNRAFGAQVDTPRNMVHFAFLLSTGLIQPISMYLADKLFHAKTNSPISLFGYIALSWKVNMMVKDVGFSSVGMFSSAH